MKVIRASKHRQTSLTGLPSLLLYSVPILLGHCNAQPLARRVLEVRRGVGRRLAGDVDRGHPRARAHARLQHNIGRGLN